MNKLLEYQLASIGFDGSLEESQILALFNIVNETYNKVDKDRVYQSAMLDIARVKIQNQADALNDEYDNKMFDAEKKYNRLLLNLQPYYFFYAKNNGGQFTSVSDSVSNMLGFTAQEFIDKYSNYFSYGFKCDLETRMLISEYGYNVPYELSLEDKKEKTYYLEVTEFLIFDADNKVLGIEGIVRDITEHTVSKNRISNMLYSDTLTGISNRLHLEVLMERLIFDTYATDNTFAMFFLDLDHFKNINDTLGHDIGDLLLQQIAHDISEIINPSDIFARIGGDEFIIIFKNIHKSELLKMIERLMTLMHKPWIIKKYELSVTASIGIVRYPEDGKSTVDLLKSADIAMYKSKSRGRNNYTFYEKKYDKSINTEMELVQDMSIALENNEFLLYYQPKVLVKDNEVISAEALLRWKHPKIGYISPSIFIPLAENTGLILRLGRWIIQEACNSIVEFNRSNPHKKLSLSINISIRQFQHENMYEVLKENIERCGIDGSQISIEITESIMMENQERMVEKLNQIKTLNVGISLDDFGTGYSTLSYLNRLSIDELKIDKAFVDVIPKDGNKSIVLDTIIAMGKTLNMSVVAEGVEHEYQRQYLKKKKCDIYQGYLFSKALPRDEYIASYIM